MTIHILVDNFPGLYTSSEHGLSYLIEYDGKKILFDTGQSDLFLKNAKKIHVNLADNDFIVLSHGHFDHGNGLQFLSSGTLLCHPGCFVKRYHRSGKTYIGLKITRDEIEKKFTLITSEIPFKISEKIIFLGGIPRLTEFESKSTSFIFENGSPDFVMDDSAIALVLNNGLFVVTGCGHSGIVNTLEYAVKITGENRIMGIIGGFHLKEADRQTKAVISYLKEHNVEYVYPAHCTAQPVLDIFYANFKRREVKTGDVIRL